MSDELTAETRIRIFGDEIDRLNARLREAEAENERLRAAIRSLRNSWPCERLATLAAICRDHPCVDGIQKEAES